MSRLTIYKDTHFDHDWQSEDFVEIQKKLAQQNIVFDRWQAHSQPVPIDQIAVVYAQEIKKLTQTYTTWDVIGIKPDAPNKEIMREKFLNEHTHAEDEVRFFVEGKGLFCLHIDDCVYQVLCEKNDLISVPAHTPHWFDMGAEPLFTVIRIFDNPEGWVANFTGDNIATRYPYLK